MGSVKYTLTKPFGTSPELAERPVNCRSDVHGREGAGRGGRARKARKRHVVSARHGRSDHVLRRSTVINDVPTSRTSLVSQPTTELAS
jgi:hypothetical protein